MSTHSSEQEATALLQAASSEDARPVSSSLTFRGAANPTSQSETREVGGCCDRHRTATGAAVS